MKSTCTNTSICHYFFFVASAHNPGKNVTDPARPSATPSTYVFLRKFTLSACSCCVFSSPPVPRLRRGRLPSSVLLANFVDVDPDGCRGEKRGSPLKRYSLYMYLRCWVAGRYLTQVQVTSPRSGLLSALRSLCITKK